MTQPNHVPDWKNTLAAGISTAIILGICVAGCVLSIVVR